MADYYVDSDVAGPGSGTIGDPWDDIASNINSLSAGDTMHLRGGAETPQEYQEASRITITVDGSSGNPITIRNYQDELVVVSYDHWHHTFDIYGDYITLQGFEIDGLSNLSQYGVVVRGDHVTLTNMEIYDQSTAGVYTTGNPSYLIVDGCEVYGQYLGDQLDATCILLRQGSNITIRGCTLRDVYGDAIYLHDVDQIVDVLIENNDIYIDAINGECAENGIDMTSGTNITIRGNTLYGWRYNTSTCGGTGGGIGEAIVGRINFVSAVIEDNEIYDSTTGIFIAVASGETTIRRNTIHNMYDDANSWLSVGIAVNRGTVYIHNNTLDQCPDKGLAIVNSAAVVDLRNNIFNATAEIRIDGIPTLTYDYNCWHDCTDTIDGANDVNADPLFTNAAGNDYTLQANSPCIDAGVDLGYPYVGSAPDMGAHEYVGGITVVVVTVVAVITVTVTVMV